ncbi:PepSY domain-containing protein [Pseudidiomarina atlantica]|uniref:PepSY domain-containing protein n=1 Tax=Pseudidiomarina atlantica TaxID=1517416 RepID=UPI00054EE30C|nr:PepSY domain-containing protein [Pseudidiomarina atlantica]
MTYWLKWLHRWTSLIILLQVLIWLITGLYFAIVGHTEIAAHQHYSDTAKTSQEGLPFLAVGDADISSIYARYSGVTSLQVRQVQQRLQYVVTHDKGQTFLDAKSGEIWQTGAALAGQLAMASYTGPGSIETITHITNSDELADWQPQQQGGYRVTINDDLNTRIYVDAASATVIDHRNDPWVIADWAFKLHFMDYSGGRDFNNLLIRAAGLITLWLALSGLILLIRNIKRGDLKLR